MEENKSELLLWVGILALIGLFIFFMPDIERLIFGRAKKEKVTTEQKDQKQEQKQEKQVKIKLPENYECILTKNESFYDQTTTLNYTFDENGKTNTYKDEIVITVKNDSYNEMKNTYQKTLDTYNALTDEIKGNYSLQINFDDQNKKINIITNIKDYIKTIDLINKYNENVENKVLFSAYSTYSSAEINLKSDGYTCK